MQKIKLNLEWPVGTLVGLNYLLSLSVSPSLFQMFFHIINKRHQLLLPLLFVFQKNALQNFFITFTNLHILLDVVSTIANAYRCGETYCENVQATTTVSPQKLALATL